MLLEEVVDLGGDYGLLVDQILVLDRTRCLILLIVIGDHQKFNILIPFTARLRWSQFTDHLYAVIAIAIVRMHPAIHRALP